MRNRISKYLGVGIAAVVLIVGATIAHRWFQSPPVAEGLVTGNGRIEATEIYVSTRMAGRVEEMLADEGDFVAAGQPLVRMQIDTLEAQRVEAEAILQQARHAVATAKAQVAMRESDLAAMQAIVVERESDLNYSKRRLARLEAAGQKNASSVQEIDEERTRSLTAQAALNAAIARSAAAEAAIEAAKAEMVGAESTVAAREATVKRIDADIKDSVLVSPRDGRIQYRIAQPGEVLAAGGRALNVIDLSDVYMTFFLPETVAGRVGLGHEVRLVLDAAPQYVVPAKISFVASSAQFTPKTVETMEERQKLMFRVRARIEPELLKKHLQQVKTGLPGQAWIKLDENVSWPAELAIKVPE